MTKAQIKTLRPLNFACAHTNGDGTNCGAQAGYRCVWQGDDAKFLGSSKFHSERLIAAASHMEDGAVSVASDAAVNTAIENAVEDEVAI